ncbi:MAG: class I SAM-dependent methyltransferase [Melioribacter sp.]|nr:class I SAM-dependent methyltransferase [Melioribacter sp.]
MKEKAKNPWLKIPAEDYERHMSAPNVLQLQMLNKIFADVLNEFQPKSIAVLGCATGNGFEHLINKNIEQIVGIDVNQEYLAICKKRFEKKLPQLELVCADLNDAEFPNSSFDLIHAALVFEYVEVEPLLSKISHWLKSNGNLSVVLQLPNDASALVSETPYQSLKLLNSIMKLIEPEVFREKVRQYELNETRNYKIKLQSGKCFLGIIFKQNKTGAQYIEPL